MKFRSLIGLQFKNDYGKHFSFLLVNPDNEDNKANAVVNYQDGKLLNILTTKDLFSKSKAIIRLADFYHNKFMSDTLKTDKNGYPVK